MTLQTHARADAARHVWKGAALELRLLPLSQLVASPFQPVVRTADGPTLSKLASSLELMGQLCPILVHPVEQCFGVLDGHRRMAAARLVGWSALQAMINPAIATRAQALQAIQEVNLQRLAYTAASALDGMQAAGVDWDDYTELSTAKMQAMLRPWAKLFPSQDERIAVYRRLGTPYALQIATRLRRYARLPRDRQADVVRWLALHGPGQLKRMRAVPDAESPTRQTLASHINEMLPLPHND